MIANSKPMKEIKKHFTEAKEILENFIRKEENFYLIEKAAKIMVQALQKGNKIISCGNGGSMSDAMHFAEELTGKFRNDRPSIAAIAISDPSYLTCVGNDYGFDHVFSRFIEGMGNPGDVLLVISTSGNSKNTLFATEKARQKNMPVIALTGKSGGKLAENCTVEIRAPYSEYSDRAQEIHIKIIHAMIDYIEHHINPG